MLSVSFTEKTLASSGAYLAGRQAISDHNFVIASKFQAKSVSADPSNSKLLESLMISFIGQGFVDKAITIAINNPKIKSRIYINESFKD